MIRGLFLSLGGPFCQHRIWAASSPLGIDDGPAHLPTWCGLCNSSYMGPVRPRTLAGSCSPADPHRTSSQSVQNEDAWAAQDRMNLAAPSSLQSAAWALEGTSRLLLHTCKATSVPSIWDPCLIPRVFNWEPKVPSGASNPLGNSALTYETLLTELRWDHVVLGCGLLSRIPVQFRFETHNTLWEVTGTPAKHFKSNFFPNFLLSMYL